MLDGGTVRFFIHSTKSIISGAEITIAFDFNYHKWYLLRTVAQFSTTQSVSVAGIVGFWSPNKVGFICLSVHKKFLRFQLNLA